MSPFYANLGYHPSANNPLDKIARNPASLIIAHWMTIVHAEVGRRLKEAKTRMKKYADWKSLEAPHCEEGQLVMLDARNIKMKRPSKKLDRKLLGLFKISKVVSSTIVKLILLEQWRIYDIFHVSLIESYRTGMQDTPNT
jgi:hypothetical protein